MSHAEPTSEPISAEIKQAAQALLTQLTLEEKAKLCSGQDFWHLEGIERLGLAPVMVTDGPHGLRKQGAAADHLGANKSIPATCFPTASSLASSWDRELMHDVGAALGEHCVEENVAVLLGPGMNIKRHPLCGRNFEYFSEDPPDFRRNCSSTGIGHSKPRRRRLPKALCGEQPRIWAYVYGRHSRPAHLARNLFKGF